MRSVLLVVFLAFSGTALADQYSGTVGKVVDADTIFVCDKSACTKIRLCGIDSPEKGAPRKKGKQALRKLLEGHTVKCIQVGENTPCDGRSNPAIWDANVAQCFVNGADIAQAMVDGGFACDWGKYSDGYYSKDDPSKACSPDHRQ